MVAVEIQKGPAGNNLNIRSTGFSYGLNIGDQEIRPRLQTKGKDIFPK